MPLLLATQQTHPHLLARDLVEGVFGSMGVVVELGGTDCDGWMHGGKSFVIEFHSSESHICFHNLTRSNPKERKGY